MGRNEIFEQALHLDAKDRFLLIEKLLKSLNKTDEKIDKLWQDEVEDRIKAYENNDMKSISMEEVFSKYKIV